jgi:hypothetical protein
MIPYPWSFHPLTHTLSGLFPKTLLLWPIYLGLRLGSEISDAPIRQTGKYPLAFNNPLTIAVF